MNEFLLWSRLNNFTPFPTILNSVRTTTSESNLSKLCQMPKRFRPSYRLPDPAPVPADRIKEDYPFAVTRVDYKGTFQLVGVEKNDNTNAYVLLFTCGVTHLMHLEAVEDMMAASFIDAFKRFTSHHTIPRIIYSDYVIPFISAFKPCFAKSKRFLTTELSPECPLISTDYSN